MQRIVTERGLSRDVSEVVLGRVTFEWALSCSKQQVRLTASKSVGDLAISTTALPPNTLLFGDGATVKFLDGGIACQVL